MENTDWTFSTLAEVWEYCNGAIVAGGDRLDAMPEPERQRSLAELKARVRSQVARCETCRRKKAERGWLAPPTHDARIAACPPHRQVAPDVQPVAAQEMTCHSRRTTFSEG